MGVTTSLDYSRRGETETTRYTEEQPTSQPPPHISPNLNLNLNLNLNTNTLHFTPLHPTPLHCNALAHKTTSQHGTHRTSLLLLPPPLPYPFLLPHPSSSRGRANAAALGWSGHRNVCMQILTMAQTSQRAARQPNACRELCEANARLARQPASDYGSLLYSTYSRKENAGSGEEGGLDPDLILAFLAWLTEKRPSRDESPMTSRPPAPMSAAIAGRSRTPAMRRRCAFPAVLAILALWSPDLALLCAATMSGPHSDLDIPHGLQIGIVGTLHTRTKTWKDRAEPCLAVVSHQSGAVQAPRLLTYQYRTLVDDVSRQSRASSIHQISPERKPASPCDETATAAYNSHCLFPVDFRLLKRHPLVSTWFRYWDDIHTLYLPVYGQSVPSPSTSFFRDGGCDMQHATGQHNMRRGNVERRPERLSSPCWWGPTKIGTFPSETHEDSVNVRMRPLGPCEGAANVQPLRIQERFVDHEFSTKRVTQGWPVSFPYPSPVHQQDERGPLVCRFSHVFRSNYDKSNRARTPHVAKKRTLRSDSCHGEVAVMAELLARLDVTWQPISHAAAGRATFPNPTPLPLTCVDVWGELPGLYSVMAVLWYGTKPTRTSDPLKREIVEERGNGLICAKSPKKHSPLPRLCL
ncbi:predicted protein [Plenodomus lingam JN3]|uniref:Predicted protein n=1 Tax=Leptosphaeria maculans (strain JN3 / isolate v23.1.3 / race Av1-4-5-6-7-8) TaxID=985895 RepID=E5A8C0_LEPMJ|nr:predicted protein [Plenodomus lingam JN3]CBX99865.1 predicted protein [Plenodomus lingam JN3]